MTEELRVYEDGIRDFDDEKARAKTKCIEQIRLARETTDTFIRHWPAISRFGPTGRDPSTEGLKFQAERKEQLAPIKAELERLKSTDCF
jgi:hypothetical protein